MMEKRWKGKASINRRTVKVLRENRKEGNVMRGGEEEKKWKGTRKVDVVGDGGRRRKGMVVVVVVGRKRSKGSCDIGGGGEDERKQGR